jgi:hypothetical protein
VITAVFILNRSPTQSVEGKTPYEVWHGEKPSVHYLRTFGCVAHVKQGSKHLGKLEDRNTMIVFIRYESGSKAWRFYNPVTRRVHVSHDAIFEEDCAWDWSEEDVGDDEPFKMEYVVAGGVQPSTGNMARPRSPPVLPLKPAGGVPVSARGEAAHTPPVPEDPGAVEYVSPPVGTPDIDEDAYGAPLHFRSLADLMGGAPQHNGFDTQLREAMLVAIGDEPATANEALKTEEWRATMMEELGSIKENKTWSFVDLQRGQKAIGLKWVFKLKHDEHGDVVKHKARLVAKGYVQRQGVDFDEVFAPVARMEYVRVMIILAAHLNWSVHHMDVKSAFLNGDLGEEVYVSQPPGFIVKGQEQKVYKLHKALYGLRQAPRTWNSKLDTVLLELGFSKCKREYGLYTRVKNKMRLVVDVYVDDLIIMRESDQELNLFKSEMKKLFQMSDLGALSYYLRIEVKQGDQGIGLSQCAYASKLLEKAGMCSCNSCATPMEAKLKLSKVSDSKPVDATMYRSLIGSLRYLLHTRPELTYSVCYLSRFMEAPKQEHLDPVKRVLRYVAGTVDYGLLYPRGKSGSLQILGYSDSDMAGDIDDCKSTTGVVFFLGDGAASWSLQKQKVVALSAWTAATCQPVWLARLLGELLGSNAETPRIMMDNQSAIALSKNLVLHARSKHIKTKYHFIRECVDRGKVTLESVGTADLNQGEIVS